MCESCIASLLDITAIEKTVKESVTESLPNLAWGSPATTSEFKSSSFAIGGATDPSLPCALHSCSELTDMHPSTDQSSIPAIGVPPR